MPAYYFVCRSCGEGQRRIIPAAELVQVSCKLCGGELERNPSPPSSQVMESLDNGGMPRRVERLADAERLFKERSKKH